MVCVYQRAFKYLNGLPFIEQSVYHYCYMLNMDYLAMHKAQMHAGTISELLYG